MQAELDAVKSRIDDVAKAMTALQEAAVTAKAAIDANVAAVGAKVAADTALKS